MGGGHMQAMFLPFCMRQKFSKLGWARVSAVRYGIVLPLTLDCSLEVVQAWGRSTRKPNSHLLNCPCISEKLPDPVSMVVLYIKKTQPSPTEMGPSLVPWFLFFVQRFWEKLNSFLLYIKITVLIFFLKTNKSIEFL